MENSRPACPVCATASSELGSVHSSFSSRDFTLRRCDGCGLSFIADPRDDFANLYDAEYYAGRGADTFVDYVREMEDPRTVREYEWRGILRAVTHLTDGPPGKWLDYGCGLGGLVRHARRAGLEHVYGFDEGFSAEWMSDHDLPVLTSDELATHAGTFDVITAIEVIEHVSDPVGVMSHVASLLKPGGLFFLTTGNAEPHREQLASWSYVHPDVHIAYFEPRTLATVYERSGLTPYEAGFVPGFEDIIRYKVLKTMRVRHRNLLERLVPWSVASRIVDRRHKVTAQPLARRP